MADGVAICTKYAFGYGPGASPIPVWFGADVKANVLGRVDVFGDDGGLHVLGGDVGDHVVKGCRVELSWNWVADDNAEHRKDRQWTGM